MIHQSGFGATGNGCSERNLLWEVMELFFGDFVPTLGNPGKYMHCKLEKGRISSYDKLLKTKLNRSKLDKETRVNWEDDAANLLFDGVTHMYNQIDITKSKEKEVVHTAGIPDNIAMAQRWRTQRWGMTQRWTTFI